MITEKELKDVLLSNVDSQLLPILTQIKKNRESNQLFSALLQICSEQDNYIVRNEVLEILREHFSTLSALSAFQHALKLENCISERKSVITSAALLHLAIISVPLMSATKLRNWIKSDLIHTFHAVYALGDHRTAAVLVICIYYTVVMEVYYSPIFNDTLLNDLQNTWSNVENVEDSHKFSIIHICSFLFYTSLGDTAKAKAIASTIAKLHLSEDSSPFSANYVFSYDYILFDFLLPNLSTIFLAFPSTKKLRTIVEFLVRCCVTFKKLDKFLTEFSKLINLRYNHRGVKIQELLFEILATSFSCEIFDPASGNDAEVIVAINGESRKRRHDAMQDSNEEKFQLRIFHGDSLVMKRPESNPVHLKLYRNCSTEMYLAQQQMKSLKKCCTKAHKFICSVLKNLEGINGSAEETKCNNEVLAAINESHLDLDSTMIAVNALVKLSSRIEAYRLPKNIVLATVHFINLCDLEFIKALFSPTFYSIIDPNTAGELMNIMRYYIEARSDFTIELNSKFVNFINAMRTEEKSFKTNVLRLVATIIKERGSSLLKVQVAPLISLCLSFFQPVAYRTLPQSNSQQNETGDSNTFAAKLIQTSCEPEVEAMHSFIMAEIGFLCATLTKFPTILAAQSAVVVGFLPDFFHQLSSYKEHKMETKIPHLEQALATLSTLIKREKNTYHKIIPFAMSNWLGTETRDLNFPLFILLSVCDNFDTALLSTNLRPREKRRFAFLHDQYYKLNKIIG